MSKNVPAGEVLDRLEPRSASNLVGEADGPGPDVVGFEGSHLGVCTGRELPSCATTGVHRDPAGRRLPHELYGD